MYIIVLFWRKWFKSIDDILAGTVEERWKEKTWMTWTSHPEDRDSGHSGTPVTTSSMPPSSALTPPVKDPGAKSKPKVACLGPLSK